MQVPLAKIVSLDPVTTPLCESHLGMESNFLYRISELLYLYSMYVSRKLLVCSFPWYTVLMDLVSLTSGSSLHLLFFYLGYPPCFVPTPPKRTHVCSLLYMCTELFLPVSGRLTPNVPFGKPVSVTLRHLGLFLYALKHHRNGIYQFFFCAAFLSLLLDYEQLELYFLISISPSVLI